MKIRILIGILLVTLASSQLTNAQKRRTLFEPYSTVGFGIGTSSYMGELAPYSTPIRTVFNMMRWSVNANYTRQFTPRFGARVGFTWARIAGDDELMNRGSSPYYPNGYLRNLHFRNDLKEFSLVGIYNLKPDGRGLNRRADFMPYIFGGIAVVAHNPKAKTPEFYENRKWVALQPLGTEGQGQPGYASPYSLVTMAVPVGFGLRLKINDRWNIGAELGFRFTLSDYLDDVSTNYADPAIFADPNATGNVLARDLSNRSLERIAARKLRDRTAQTRNILGLDPSADPFGANQPLLGHEAGDLRGNLELKDSYLLGIISVSYVLPGKIKCPPLR
ncbi:MAG: hypothetical protein EAZ70_07260 [Runella slithyformis]|nr:MAG: hypothetical protein EAZ70_07260 [Runella slithyformis]TAF46219.1 MAG: hypothetical protein EAZ63_09695 [Runella slithyformis]